MMPRPRPPCLRRLVVGRHLRGALRGGDGNNLEAGDVAVRGRYFDVPIAAVVNRQCDCVGSHLERVSAIVAEGADFGKRWNDDPNRILVRFEDDSVLKNGASAPSWSHFKRWLRLLLCHGVMPQSDATTFHALPPHQELSLDIPRWTQSARHALGGVKPQ